MAKLGEDLFHSERTGCNDCHDSQTKFTDGESYDPSDDAGSESAGEDPAKSLDVPSLRYLALSAPYYHDGSIATLEEAVKDMAWLQLGKKLSDEDTASLVAFLKALTGEIPAEFQK